MPLSDRALCFAHLFIGAALIVLAAVMDGYGHGGGIVTALFGAGATLLPTAPSGLLRQKGGTLVADTVAAVAAGGAIASGQSAEVVLPQTSTPGGTS